MANAITLTDIAAARIFAGDRVNASVPVAGTVTITSGTPSIQAQVVESGDIYAVSDIYAVTDVYSIGGSVVVAWTTVVASPSTGSYSSTISVPIHSTMVQLQVRLSDLSASSLGTNNWGVGYLVGAIGQSNMQNMWLTTASPAPADSRASYYIVTPSAPGWIPAGSGSDTGDGMIAFVNALIAMVNAPVGVILGAVGGTALDQAAANPIVPLEYWLHLGGNPANYPQDYLYQAYADAIVATGSDLCAQIWLQGEQEAASNFPLYAQYQADILILANRTFALCPLRTPGTNLFFHVGVIGFFSGTGALVVDGLRNAMIQAGLSGGGLQLGPCTYDAPMLNQAPSITVHHTAAGYVILGHRWAMQVGYWLLPYGTFSACPATSPRITSATRQGKYLLMTVVQPPGGLFLQQIPPPPASGFTFSTDNFNSTISPTLLTQADPGGADLTQIVAVFATDPGAQIQIKHQAGNPSSFFPVPSTLQAMYGGRNPPSEPVGLPLQHAGAGGIITTQDPATFGGVPIFPTLSGLGWSVTRKSIGGSTNVQENISGKQTAIGYWSSAKYQWGLTYEFLKTDTDFRVSGSTAINLSSNDYATLLGFFNAIRGRLTPFLWQDPDDCILTNQFIGIGDGVTTTFQITRTVGNEGSGEAILAPNLDTNGPNGQAVSVTLNGVATGTAVYTRYGSGSNPGQLIFSPAPSNGNVIQLTASFYWPVRFDDDDMTFDKFMTTLLENKKVTFTSVKN